MNSIKIIRDKCNVTSQWLAVLVALAIPFSTAAMNLFFGLAVLFLLLGSHWHYKWQVMKSNPLIPSVLLLFFIYVVGMFYSEATWQQRFLELGKYHKLLLIPLLLPLFTEEKWRVRMVIAFLVAMFVSMLLSYLQFFNIIFINNYFGQASIFKNHSTQNLLMAIVTFITLYASFEYRKYFWPLIAYSVLALMSVIFLSGGRVGYLTVTIFLILFFFNKWHIKGLVFIVVVLTALFITSMTLPTPLKSRMQNTINSLEHKNEYETATSIRASEAKTTWRMIQAHPVLGTGTGSYTTAYQQLSPKHDFSDNAQIQYFQTWAELGLLGLLIFCNYLFQQWRLSKQLPEHWCVLAKVLVIAQVLGGLSLLILSDTTESHFFALFIAVCFAAYAPERSINEKN
jgi:O-antigen ligase